MTEVFTIGYEGASLGDFIATLRMAGIQRILDVRQIAQSRRRGFSKNPLKLALGEANIEYTHLRALGDPKPGREAARQGRYEEFSRIFEAHLDLEETQLALREAATICEGEATALLCFERNPQFCHRTLVAKRLMELSSLSIRHLGVVHGAESQLSPMAETA